MEPIRFPLSSGVRHQRRRHRAQPRALRDRLDHAIGRAGGILIDVIGSWNLTEQDISVTVPVIVGSAEVGRQTITQGLRTDIVDLAVGFKAAFAQSVVGFAAVFIPLNDDGLRSDATPTAGLEVSF